MVLSYKYDEETLQYFDSDQNFPVNALQVVDFHEMIFEKNVVNSHPSLLLISEKISRNKFPHSIEECMMNTIFFNQQMRCTYRSLITATDLSIFFLEPYKFFIE